LIITGIHKILKRPYSLAKRIDRGRGQPVVFLHGLAATAESWKYTIDLLDDKKYHSIAFDLLGFGNSPQPDWLEYSVEDHAKAVLASLRRMHITRPVVLAGHSMGSLVAAYIAQNYPHKVKHLILYQMPVYSEVPDVKLSELRRQAYLSVFRYLAEHPRLTLWYAKVLGRMASKVAGFSLDARTWQPFELSLRNTIMQQHSYENLRLLTMPTDVIYGKYDVLVLRKSLQHYFRPSKYVRFYEIDELHRISARAGELIKELIVRGPERPDNLTLKHARIVELIDIHKLAEDYHETSSGERRNQVLVAAMAFLALLITAAAALPGTVHGWELQTFLWINHGSNAFTAVARIASDLVWAIVLLVGLLFLVRRYMWAAWRIAVPAVLTYVAVFFLEILVGRGRPAAVLPHDAVVRAVQDGMGYPSGHVATLTAIVVTVWPYLSKPFKVCAILFICLEGWARMYLGLHFPLDVLGGAALGMGIAMSMKALPDKVLQKLRLAT
jgi:pimeloyl-ACP methyl ester carboxylesterase/membrane-associated phospholipid phosphatase